MSLQHMLNVLQLCSKFRICDRLKGYSTFPSRRGILVATKKRIKIEKLTSSID